MEKLEPQQKLNSEFWEPSILEKIRKNWNVYRPFGDKDLFLTKLSAHVENLLQEEKDTDIIIVGDINIDLLNDNIHSEKLLDITIQMGFLQQVTLPTRVTDTTASLIDHVYTRSKRSLVTDVISSDIADHYLTLTSYPKDNPRKEKNLNNQKMADK